MTQIPSAWERLSGAVRTLLVTLFGRWRWDAPAWLRATCSRAAGGGRYLAAHPKHAGALILLLAAAIAGYVWYASRPTPHYVTYTITEPGLTEYNENGISSIKSMKVVFSESAAQLRQVKTAVTTGIDLSPALTGSWFWTSDRELQFTPKDDWPVDGAFSVRLARKGLFPQQVLLEAYSFKFRSQPFATRIAESQFYQDPRDPNLKKLVATVAFSHPVDTAQFESHVWSTAVKRRSSMRFSR